jgi:serine protease Do
MRALLRKGFAGQALYFFVAHISVIFNDMEYQDKVVRAINKALPGVISIAASKDIAAVEQEVAKMGMDPRQLADRFAQEAEGGKITVSTGSGFIVDPSGIVLTNKHVIQDAEASYQAVINEKKYDVVVLGKDPLSDIAVLKITAPPPKLPTIKLCVSKKVRLGETVIAIGNALGEFQNTVSTGIVSGLSRFLSAITDMQGHQERLRGLIQTDAAINPGNSGGPLINLKGEAIGISTAVVFGAQNIGFAIPIDRAIRDLEDVKKQGHIRAPFLGIRYVLLNKKLSDHLGIQQQKGALIMREGLPGDNAILPNSAAERAGLLENDIVVSANGKEVTEKNTLEDELSERSVGDEVELGVLRKNKHITFKVPLEDRGSFA